MGLLLIISIGLAILFLLFFIYYFIRLAYSILTYNHGPEFSLYRIKSLLEPFYDLKTNAIAKRTILFFILTFMFTTLSALLMNLR